MDSQKMIFKNMSTDELLKHFSERKAILENTKEKILDYKQKLKLLRKQSILEAERLRTVSHWISSRKHK